MEAALASGLLKAAGDKLVSLIASEFDSILSVKKDLSELKEILERIARWLSALQNREMETDSSFPSVKKLKNVAYDIDDLLYHVHLEAEKQDIESDGEKNAVADCFCAKPKSFMFRCKMVHKIKAIKVRLDEIVKQTSDMNTILPSLPVHQPAPCRNNATAELNLLGTDEESKIPRRDQEKDKIVSKLVESNEGDNVLIVSIIGLGGSGKTTLAKHICQDEKIKKDFKDTIFRVHVSREFDVHRLIGKLFEDITKEKSDLHSLPHMVNEISNKLSNKFLLVLDDAWNKNRLEWEQFMCHVNRGAPGSRVLLTTRDQKVAEAVESWHILKLAFLSELESWGFFLKISGWTEEEGSELIQVGKDIVKKCGGVPLAIKILGSVLRGKSEISTLRAIRGSSLWNEEDIEEQAFASLKLSYIHLENHLKPCFTFCSIFPKGYEIIKDHLIAQWIAHGFVNPQNEDRPEDIGSEYFDSLVKVGFLQDSLEIWYNEEPIYKMHDLVHDLTRKILQHEMGTSLQRNIPADCTHKCRYFSLTSYTQKFDKGLFDKVRAIYVSYGNPSLDKQVKKNCYIRNVVLDYTTDTPFPLFILKFENLGYLEIHNVSCIQLPEAISGCWNLQALYFIYCKGFVTLPESIGKLKKLRALELKQIIDLESLPQSIGDCRGLQYLKLYYCYKLRQIPNSIGKIENLRVLQIVSCTDVQQLPSEFIGEFNNIQTINLAGCPRLQDLPNTFPSRTLRTLNLSRTSVTTLPEWVTLIGTLECINLEDCRKLVELPRGIGNLKRLEVLNIQGCWNLRCMPSGFGQLTRLKMLGLFVVGCGGDGASILELENLDMLSGDMKMMKLEYVTDPGDAEKACLKRKKNIQNLELNWSSSGTEEELVSDNEKDLGVLDALEPPSEIKKFKNIGYGGPHLPCWMRKQSDSSYLEGAALKQTRPPQFLCLTELTLRKLPNLKHMQGLPVLPSLKHLVLDEMPNLEELWTTINDLEIGEEEVGEQYCFPVLSHLRIMACPKLIVEPYFPPCLESLELRGCNDQLLSPGRFRLLPPDVDEPSSSSRVLGAVPHLKELRLEGMTASSTDWGFLQHLIGLEFLRIWGCNDLTELPESMRGLNSLQGLEIWECSTLAVLPEWLGELRSLQFLRVCGAPMMASFPQSISALFTISSLFTILGTVLCVDRAA